MKITIIYDNEVNKPGLKAGWGFSFLIEIENTPPILFDTGADGTTLLHNMKELGINSKVYRELSPSPTLTVTTPEVYGISWQ